MFSWFVDTGSGVGSLICVHVAFVVAGVAVAAAVAIFVVVVVGVG